MKKGDARVLASRGHSVFIYKHGVKPASQGRTLTLSLKVRGLQVNGRLAWVLAAPYREQCQGAPLRNIFALRSCAAGRLFLVSPYAA